MKRITRLDGVRGVAILLVIVWHYFACHIGPEPTGPLAYGAMALKITWTGVDLFFVLSGFLIGGLLLDHRGAANFFRVFYLRRACRIFPLYFLLLGLFVGLRATPLFTAPSFEWLFYNPFPLWSYASFTQNVFMGLREDFGPHWLAVTWSLAVEEQFYLVVPLLVYFLPRRLLVVVLAAGILTAPWLRHAWPGFHAFVNTPWRADSLLSGVLLAVMVRSPLVVARLRQHRGVLLIGFGALVLGALTMALVPPRLGYANHLWLATLYATLVLIVFLEGDAFVVRIMESRALVWLGQLSYGIYMFHQAVNGLLHGWWRGNVPQLRNLADAGTSLVALGLTLGLAMLSYRFMESPILRFGHRFTYRPKAPSAAASMPALAKT